MTTTRPRDVRARLTSERPRHPEVPERSFLTVGRQFPEGVSSEELLMTLIDVADEIANRLGSRTAWTVKRVTVAVAGNPAQGPDVPIPPGFALTVRFRKPSTGSPAGFVATSAGFVGDTTSRIELPGNGSVQLKVSNMNAVWVGADTNESSFEFIAEQ